jgi:hypothetical protein
VLQYKKEIDLVADFFTQSARLVPYTKRPRGATGFVTVVSDEPRPDDPAYGLGNFYAVIEVVSGGREAEEAAGLAVQTAQAVYFAEDGSDNLLDRFEQATKAVNRALTDYVNRGNAGWVGKMSGVMAILEGQNLHLAYTGSGEAFLYRGPHATRITVQPHNRIQQPSKIFGSIASGQLEIGDKLLLATPALVHQLALSSLKTTVSENSPNGALAKITQQLNGQAGDRIAALILEFSTPDLAAQLMPGQASAVATLPRSVSLLDGAKSAAGPILGEAAGRSAELAGKAHKIAEKRLPQLRQFGWGAAARIRPVLQDPKRRLIVGVVAAVIIVASIWSMMSHGHAATSSQASSQISQLIVDANADQQRVIDQDASVRPDLIKLQSDLTRLDTKGNQSFWKAAGTDPSTLASQLQSDIDQLDHVIAVQPSTISDLSKAGQPKLLAVTGGVAVTVNSNNGSLVTADVHSGTVRSSANHLNGVVALAPSSGGDGVYVLTNQPAVYLYKPLSDSLTQVSGGWERGTGLVSYTGNLYELSSKGVTKRVPTLTGFSAATSSIPASAQGVNGATSLAVDGAIYLGGPNGVYRYVAGSLTGHLPMPAGLTSITALAPGNGDYVLAIDAKGGRLALLTSQTSGITLSAEYSVSKLTAASLDVTNGKIYAISGNKLVSYTLPR